MDLAGLPAVHNRCSSPDTVKGCSSRVKNIHGIEFSVLYDAGWRYRANPAFGLFPCANCCRVIHADRPVILDDLPAAFRELPLQSITGQSLGTRPLPNITPEVFLAFGTLTCLNPRGHQLEFVPRLWRMVVAVFAEKIRAIF